VRSNKIDWSDLKFFLAIAREESLAGAAASLGVTHSTVFRRINSLEEGINVKLFSRNADGYRLTDIGKEVLYHVNKVAGHVDDLQRLLDNRNNELRGEIHITAPHNLAYKFLPRYISEFRKEYPEIRINLMVSNKDYNLSRLEADIAIRATSSPPMDLVGRRLFSLRWGAYASEDYIKELGKPVNMEGLQKHRLISSNQALIQLPAFQWVEKKLPKDCIVARCNDLMSMSAFAVSGVGIALLPDDQAKPELIRLIGLPRDIVSDIWLLIHPDMRQCRRLTLFREYLTNAFRSDPLFQQYGIVE
jgi:DNA-binding transcriptional LysR family regulator